MLAFTEKIINSPLRNHAFTSEELARFIGGTEASRYALVNKAMKKGEVIRLHRGVYILSSQYLIQPFSKFYLATRLQPHCYISLESALAFHSWIPERVSSVRCIIPQGRHKQISNVYGDFYYYPLPTNTYEFLTGVERKEEFSQPFLVATPLRALCDLIYVNKLEKVNISFIVESLRVEPDDLLTVSTQAISQLVAIYRSKRVLNFLETLRKELIGNGE